VFTGGADYRVSLIDFLVSNAIMGTFVSGCTMFFKARLDGALSSLV